MAEKNENQDQFDPRLLERRDPRRELPPEIDLQIREILFDVTVKKTVVDEENVIHLIPEDERRPSNKLREEKLGKDERVKLDEVERQIVRTIIRRYLQGAVEALGLNHESIVPYKENVTTTPAMFEINELIATVEHSLKGQESERSVIILAELGAIKNFLEGGTNMLRAAGPMMEGFYDGLGAMVAAVRARGRYDVRSSDLDKLYRFANALPEWKLGVEIKEKQDRINSILRSIAGVHRNKSRNMGREVVGDYKYSLAQQEFIERVFGSNQIDEKTGDRLKDVLVIAEKVSLADLERLSREYFIDGKNSAVNLLEGKNGEIKVVVGNESEVNDNFIKSLRSNKEKFMWVNGLRWPINEETINEVKWKVGSGDTVLIEDATIELSRENYKKVLNSIGKEKSVYIAKERSRRIDNIFVVDQTDEILTEVRRKLGALMSSNIWERLDDPDADLKSLLEEFNKKLDGYKNLDILDAYLLDSTRIGLLFMAEGAHLGWGFEYSQQELGKEGSKYKVDKRIVSSGGTSAANDMSTPFFWLQTEANNKWKDWSRGTLPLDDKMRRQIREHEPGWAPWVDKENGIWRLSYEINDKTMNIVVKGVPTKFNMSFFEAINFVEAGQDLMVDVGGKKELQRPMDLIRMGVKMSEINWSKIIGEAQYRWYITLGQLAFCISLLSKLPDKDVVERFFGESAQKIDLFAANEFMKRTQLGLRDLKSGKKLIEKVLPFLGAINMSWSFNFFKNSPNVGSFNTKEVRKAVNQVCLNLEDIQPEGDQDYGKRIAGRLRDYINDFMKLGLENSIEKSRKTLFMRLFGNRR